MLTANKGTRDLLPLIQADPKEIVAAEAECSGCPIWTSEVPTPVAPAASRPAFDLALGEQDDGSQPAPTPIKALAPSLSAPLPSEALGGEAEGLHTIPVSSVQGSSVAKPLVNAHQGAAGGGNHREGGQAGRPEQDDGEASHGASDPGGTIGEIDEVHSIDVTQIAEIDQDASIIVHGYAGEVVARLRIDQDIEMDQDVEIAFTIDGDGRFAVLLDQDMRIDQETEITLKIFDDNGVLYVDLFLRDSIEVDQETTLDMRIFDGPPGGTVEVDQDIELDQDVDIEIDIEDELEERYIVKADVDVVQEVDADQDATVDITDWNGEIDMDVSATQTALIDQETMARIDFSVV
jgi:hypothetical protein